MASKLKAQGQSLSDRIPPHALGGLRDGETRNSQSSK